WAVIGGAQYGPRFAQDMQFTQDMRFAQGMRFARGMRLAHGTRPAHGIAVRPRHCSSPIARAMGYVLSPLRGLVSEAAQRRQGVAHGVSPGRAACHGRTSCYFFGVVNTSLKSLSICIHESLSAASL